MFDLILAGGTIVDGSGEARYEADLGIQDDRIAAIGDLRDASAGQRLNLQGSVVAPGFIDVHNHSDGWLLRYPNLTPKTSQGFTTEVLMSDGISYAPVNEFTYREWFTYLRGLNGLQLRDYRGWQSLGEFAAYAEGRSAQNFALQIPYANVRTLVKGFDRAPLTDEERKRVRYEVAAGMDQGAVGLSTGLDYIAQCFSTTDEIVDACRAMAPRGGIYVTHVRYKDGLLEGVREAIDIAERAGVPLHVSHLKPLDEHGIDDLLALMDEAERRVDFSFDTYPYYPGSTMLSYLLPYEVWDDGPLAAIAKLNQPDVRERFRCSLEVCNVNPQETHIAWTAGKDNHDLQGLTLAQLAEKLERPLHEALLDLLVEERLAVLMVLSGRRDELIDPMLGHSKYMMGSDGIFFEDGVVHPRMYASTGKFLQRCVRDKKLITLEDAVYKLAGHAADRFRLAQRGRIREQFFADLVVFTPDRVSYRATFEDPHQTCEGIDHVLVNGRMVIQDGNPSSITLPGPGRYVRFCEH